MKEGSLPLAGPAQAAASLPDLWAQAASLTHGLRMHPQYPSLTAGSCGAGKVAAWWMRGSCSALGAGPAGVCGMSRWAGG